MGRVLKSFIEDNKDTTISVCKTCKSHVTCDDWIVSKAFQGATGRAYLYSHVINTSTGHQDAEKRTMTTGEHWVKTVCCVQCGEALGWYYVTAEPIDQKYKEGKYCIERSMLQDL